jgi:hypothetical protein
VHHTERGERVHDRGFLGVSQQTRPLAAPGTDRCPSTATGPTWRMAGKRREPGDARTRIANPPRGVTRHSRCGRVHRSVRAAARTAAYRGLSSWFTTRIVIKLDSSCSYRERGRSWRSRLAHWVCRRQIGQGRGAVFAIGGVRRRRRMTSVRSSLHVGTGTSRTALRALRRPSRTMTACGRWLPSTPRSPVASGRRCGPHP